MGDICAHVRGRRHAAPVLFACLFALLPAAAWTGSDDILGSISYMEGTVSVVRDDAEIDGSGIGTELQNFDHLTTGSDGAVEIAITTSRAPRMTLKLSPDTSFTLELTVLRGKQQTTIGIIGGAIALKVSKLSAGQDVRVRTDSTTMGVRGTAFTVTAPASGDILVTTDEGDVLCTDEQGRDLHATPGFAVENLPGELYRATPVPATGLETFRSTWEKGRAASLQKNALKHIVANARLYERLAEELAQGRKELARSSAIISKWRDENKKGQVGRQDEVQRERAAIGAILSRLRGTQFRLERVAYRLRHLRALQVHQKGFSVETIDGGVTTARFFERLDRERADVDEGLALTGFLSKMYAKRSDGEVP